MTKGTAMDAGYYWIRRPASGPRPSEWTVAKFDGDDELGWTFIGSLGLADTADLFGQGEGDDALGYVLGPRIEAPPL